jgi:hypothetical protein
VIKKKSIRKLLFPTLLITIGRYGISNPKAAKLEQVRTRTFIRLIGSRLNQGEIARVVPGPAKIMRFLTRVSTVLGNNSRSLHSQISLI